MIRRNLLAAVFATLPALAQSPHATPPPPTGTVEGRVLGPDGQPMRNVEVIAAPDRRSSDVLARTRTDGEGMFVIARLPVERGCSIRATVPGLTTATGFASLTPEQPNAGVELRLWHANTLRGRVVDTDGKPIANAAVLGSKDFAFFATLSPEARTDAEGRFELRGVPIGDCVVRAAAPGFVMGEHPVFAVSDTEVEVRLARGPGVQLTVSTEGLPVEVRTKTTVHISVTRGGTSVYLPRFIERNPLDADGRLVLTGLPDAEWTVSLEAEGFTFEPRGVRTKSGHTSYTLPFRAAAEVEMSLRGVLRSTDGKPLANQTLSCGTRQSQSMKGGPRRATTDAEGRFVLQAPLVLNESYNLQLVGSPWALQQEKNERSDTVDLRSRVRWQETADPTRELALVAAPASFVTGRLLDPDGKPVPFVWTNLQGRRANVQPPWGDIANATSTRDGRLQFPGVHGLDLDLRLHATGTGAGSSEEFRLQAGERREVKLVMERPGVVRGRVFGADGTPLAGVRVSMGNYNVATRQQIDGSWDVVPSDREGRFVFTGVAPGGHMVTLSRHETAGKGQTAVFDVAPGGTAEVDLQLAR